MEEMLVQHLLTERLFRTIFDNSDFTRRNIIAKEIEKVIDALTSRAFNRADFLKSLDRYYVAIENAERTITEWSEKQSFLNQVYERFFQGYSIREADTHGIVYTPQEIVGFMLARIRFFLQGVIEQSRDAVRRSDQLLQLWRTYRQRLQESTSSGLALRLVDHLFEAPVTSVPGAAQKLNITLRSAQMTVNRLINAEILQETTGRQRNRIYVASEILHAVEQAEA